MCVWFGFTALGNMVCRFFTSEGLLICSLMDLQLVVWVDRVVTLSHSHEQIMIFVPCFYPALAAARVHQDSSGATATSLPVHTPYTLSLFQAQYPPT